MSISGVFKKISESKTFNNHVKKVINDDIFAARMLVGSNVLKDAIVYSFRYNKSANNEEIPEEKREFVASMDMASGITTCVVQLALAFVITNRKMQAKACDKLFGHLKNKSKELYSISKKGFIAAAALIGSGVIGERVLVPLIATPIASHLKEKYVGKKIQAKKANKNNNNSYNPYAAFTQKYQAEFDKVFKLTQF